MQPIETAGALYREIKSRGLHLRKENGRDNALLHELRSKLGCPDENVQSFLDTSDLSAEAFLKVFLQLASPFAMMFQDIWSYLDHNCAPKARETIAIRFGFESDTNQKVLDIEQFRRYVETNRRVFAQVNTQLWPFDALRSLFSVADKVIHSNDYEQIWELYHRHGRYEPGKPYDLPQVNSTGHPFDEVVQNIRDVFQQIIDDYVIEMEQECFKKKLPDLICRQEDAKGNPSLQRFSYLLTDLLPTWYYIIARCEVVENQPKDAALHVFDTTVKPLLQSGDGMSEATLFEALDILDLPFWLHRWHTYEIWGSILTLRSLKEYRPLLRIGSGYLGLDGYAATIIADLNVNSNTSACVAIQVETPFRQGRRVAIKPDLRICFSDPSLAENTAGVVEFKQRSSINTKDLSEMGNSYSKGCPRSGGVLILNYDYTGMKISLPPVCHFIEGVQPLNKKAINLFQRRLFEVLHSVNFEPADGKAIVLLDVSSSMGTLYRDMNVQNSLRQFLYMSWVKILCFNNGLVKGGDFDPSSAQHLTTSGGTQLGQALLDIESLFGLPASLLIVTDG